MFRDSLLLAVCLALAIAMCACHSAGINVTIRNSAQTPLRNVELDYPGAAFGIGSIAPGSSYGYRIKPTGDGKLLLKFEHGNGLTYRENGPEVHREQDGDLTIIVDQDASNQWRMRVEER